MSLVTFMGSMWSGEKDVCGVRLANKMRRLTRLAFAIRVSLKAYHAEPQAIMPAL